MDIATRAHHKNNFLHLYLLWVHVYDSVSVGVYVWCPAIKLLRCCIIYYGSVKRNDPAALTRQFVVVWHHAM